MVWDAGRVALCAGGVECEELLKQFGLGQRDGAVEVVRELEAEETGGVKIQRDLIVLSDSGYEGMEVVGVAGKDERVVDVDKNVDGFCGFGAVE